MNPIRKPNRRTVQTQITLEPELLLRLNDFSKTVGRPKSWIVRDALRYYIEMTQQNLPKAL